MALGAVSGAWLASGRLRLVGRRPLGERGGLAPAGSLLLFEQAGQALDVGFQLVDTAL